MKIELEFKPHSLENGIVLYSAQSNDGIGDYVSLALRNGYLEFRYNTGSGKSELDGYLEFRYKTGSGKLKYETFISLAPGMDIWSSDTRLAQVSQN